ncbi:hypothetical protein [Actinoplanes auranticolor]|uniref:LPXTG-motif cell wall-anchored protein n=1 Tax=Actinoplanes auranticolor TaxID=47988 RepID=A0A919SNU7_9ACTN|nr:hypothetical protein [Actinoplanes auranticolor]GIM75631.1 hypothetical protein Aau02nite_66840 [Actinoplanes auranticolor]
MKTILRALGAALVTAGVLAVPSVAQAADDVPLFGALTERDANGRSVTYPIHRGETIPVVLGVTNRGTAPSAGVVVNIRVFNELRLPRTFTNCWYYTDSNLDGAWCEFEGDLPVGGTYALSPFQVSAAADAKDFSGSVIFQWFPKDWVDKNGGIKDSAEEHGGPGTTPVAGTGGKLTLEPKELPVPEKTERVGFAYVKLTTPTTTPPTTAPTTAPTSAPTATPTGTPAAPAPATTPPADGGSGGGLAVTGSNAVAIAGVGGLLLVAGVVAFLLTRRRNRFTA